nr:LysR family transcriptional regulator [Gluconacetobacter tumulisoli]
MPFDLQALEVFLAVCESGGMAAAARQIGVSQPAVSQIIGDIESRSGTILFDRSVRPMALTASGMVLRQHAMSLTTEARRIAIRLRETQAGRINLVRVGSVDSLSRAVMGQLSAFLRTRVDQAVIHSGLTETHATALFTRQLDLIIGVNDFEDIAGLERWPLMEEPYLFLCPAGEKIPGTPQDLLAMSRRIPFIRFSARSRTGQEIERYLRRLRLDLPAGQEFDSPYGVTAACRQGGMAITTPLCLLECDLALDGLRWGKLPGPTMGRGLTIVARRRELGRLPADLAATLRRTLRDDVVPRLASVFPDFVGQMHVVARRTEDGA